MAKFLNRALSLLEGLYRMEGSMVSTDQIDLSRPITLVHDTARGAAMLSAFTNADGYMLITATHTHVGAGSLFTSVDPYLVTDAARKSRAQTRIWALHSFGDVSAAGGLFTEGIITRLTPVLPTGSVVSSRPQLLARYDQLSQRFAAASNFMLDATVPNTTQFPVNIGPGPLGGTGGIHFMSIVTGAVEVRLALMCWAGPRGAEPPPG